MRSAQLLQQLRKFSSYVTRSDRYVKMIVVILQRYYARNAQVIKVYFYYGRVSSEKSDKQRSGFLVVTGLKIAYWNSGSILSQRADIDLQAIHMGTVRLEFTAARQADVPNAKLSAIHRLPLSFDKENHCHQCRMRVLPSPLLWRPVHVVTRIFWRLRQHEIAARVFRLNFEHDQAPVQAIRLVARSHPPVVFPPAPPPIFCWVYLHLTFENLSETES